jgi:hypothetical protein
MWSLPMISALIDLANGFYQRTMRISNHVAQLFLVAGRKKRTEQTAGALFVAFQLRDWRTLVPFMPDPKVKTTERQN